MIKDAKLRTSGQGNFQIIRASTYYYHNKGFHVGSKRKIKNTNTIREPTQSKGKSLHLLQLRILPFCFLCFWVTCPIRTWRTPLYPTAAALSRECCTWEMLAEQRQILQPLAGTGFGTLHSSGGQFKEAATMQIHIIQ